MRVLVTGASGFIGRHCLSRLCEQANLVYGLSRSSDEKDAENLRWIKADILESSQIDILIEKTRPTHLLHLAWVTEHGLYWSDEENLHWVDKSIELVKKFVDCGGHRVVVGGTCAEYAWSNGVCREGDSVFPLTVYGKAKNALRLALEELSIESCLSLAWARLFFIFGPYEDERRLIPSIIRSILYSGKAVCNSGALERDFLYVEDAARALVSILKSDYEGVVNVSSGSSHRIKDVVSKIAEKMNALDSIEFAENPSDLDIPLLVGDNSILRDALEFEYEFTLDDALVKSVDWWLDKEKSKQDK